MARTITIEPLVAAWLAARVGFIALAGERLYPWGTHPQGDDLFPYMLYCQTGGDRFRSTRGPTTRVSWATIQFDAIGRTYADATILADAVCMDLESLQGESLDGHKIQSVRCRLPGLDGDDPVFGDEVTQPRKTFVCKIHFEEG